MDFTLTKTEWAEVGEYANSLIRNDMAQGIFQTPDGNCTKPFYNKQYAKYKANGMRRFTKITKNGKRKEARVSKRTGFTSGDRLKGYAGQTIESMQTNFVDMTLTGKTKRGLKVKRIFGNGVECGYESKDSKKLEGNNRYKRLIVGLNDKNIKLVKEKISEILNRNLIQMPPQNINIEVKF